MFLGLARVQVKERKKRETFLDASMTVCTPTLEEMSRLYRVGGLL